MRRLLQRFPSPVSLLGSLPGRLVVAGLAIVAVLAAPRAASADVFDLAFQRLVKPPAPGGFADPNSDPAALAAYRQLVSELGVAIAPSILTTADTIGYNGFQFDFDYSVTTISNAACQSGATVDQCPWQAGTEGGRGGAGIPSALNSISVMARKGIWLPLPSFELGIGATKLMQSNLYTLQAYAKFAIHEGYHRFPFPSVALRGSVARVLGESQIDLTEAQVDLQISKSFGIAGSVTLVPYLGAAWLYILPRGQVLDLTPSHDAFNDGPNSLDLNNNTVFGDQANANIQRWRFFGGLRLNYHVLVLTTDFAITPCGDFNGTCKDTRHATGKVPDNAKTQFTFSLGAGFMF